MGESVFGFLGRCCGGVERGKVGYCSLFYAGLYSSLITVGEALRGGVKGFVREVASRNGFDLRSEVFWRLLFREYVYPVLLVNKVINEVRGGGCVGSVFAREFERLLRSEEYMDLDVGEMGWGSGDRLDFVRAGVLFSMVEATLEEDLGSGFDGAVPSEAQVLLKEDFLEDLVLTGKGRRKMVVVRSRVFGGLSEMFLWIFASRLVWRGVVSGVFSLRRFMEKRALGYSLAGVDRLVVLSYDGLSREYMVSLGHLPSSEFEVWLEEEGGVFSVNVFVLRSLEASSVLLRVWNGFDKYLDKVF